ncbi:MAG TPA: hypothetical protein VME23_21895 [Terracidiphilus sp.]|nr:hypothetical protein [Terracidiphilus sp.]
MRKQHSFWRRHRVLAWFGGFALLLLIAAGIGITIVLHNAEPILRTQIVATLERQFHARVELDSFHISIAGGLRAEGRGLRIWPPAQVQGVTVPSSAAGRPLISIDEFHFRAPLHYSPNAPLRISVVELRGLVVDLPPASHFIHAAGGTPSAGAGSDAFKKALLHFRLDGVVCRDTVLRLETSKPGKLPLVFPISSLKLTGISTAGTMGFTADLVNAVPRGTVHTTGKFGPWSDSDPGESAIEGQYIFDNANLGDFKDIAGTLHSAGSYTGTLRELAVNGAADVPNFALTHIGTAMPLHAQFNAKVDATNGDTWLQPVDAVLGESHFTVEGQVVRVPLNDTEASASKNPHTNPRAEPQTKGHDISLMVNVPQGRMEDFLRLVTKSGEPILTGVLNLKTSLDIPPGNDPVHLRIRLKGNFLLDNAQFTSAKIQDRVNELSLRGQGITKSRDKSSAAPAEATMQSSFTVADGVVTLPDLVYQVPGANIALSGTYVVDGGALNFAGKAKMQATVSQMIGGWKGALASPLDRFFKKDGAGTEVGVSVDGTRDSPQFGFDLGKIKHTSPQRPGANIPDNGPVTVPPQQQ